MIAKKQHFCLTVVAIALLLVSAMNPVYAAEPAKPLKEAAKENPGNYPPVVLYSTSWCPHCKQAQEYFEVKKIPFVLRDVELDPQAEKLLTGTYKSQGVPLVVVGTGSNEVVLRGFSQKRFEEALKKAQAKK